MPSETHLLTLADALVGPDFAPSGPVDIRIADGIVSEITPLGDLPPGPRRLALPAPINAHDHARPLSTTSFGAADKPLETWLVRLAAIPAVDAGLAATAALGRAARGGVAGAMVHYTRTMGFTSVPEEAAQVAKAAREIGIRVGFALALRDRNPLVYGDHAPLLADLAAEDESAAATVSRLFDRAPTAPGDLMTLVDEIAEAAAGPGFDVQYGPAGVQWCSRPLLEAIAEASARTGRRVHMHLLETPDQRAWADKTFPNGIVPYLAEIGLLSERLTLAHCVFARPHELEILAGHGVTIAVNTSSNLHLKNGIAPVREMLARGVRVALGVDGSALDEDDDVLREMRLLRALHGGLGFAGGLGARDVLRATCVAGRRGIGAPEGGVLAVGAPADVLVLDLDGLDRDAILPVDPRDLLFTRARTEHVVTSFVGGRPVVAEGRVTGVDLDAVEAELRARYRAAMPNTAAFRAAWPRLEPRLAAFYRDRFGCC